MGMRDNKLKARENHMRHMAARQGLRLEKCPRRDRRAYDWGTYHLVNAATNVLEVWGLSSGYGLSLDEIEQILKEDQPLITVPRQLVRAGGWNHT